VISVDYIDSRTIKLSWSNSNEDENCTGNYDIEWKDITDGSRNGSANTTNNTYVIDDLEACITLQISVIVVDESCIDPEPAFINVTRRTDGKWHVICRFMTCACTTSYSECIQYSHQLKLLFQISYV
jgi:hypothetical protein